MLRFRDLTMLMFMWVGLALPPAATAEPAAVFSESELKSFAGAVLDVQRINDTYVEKFGTARTFEEQENVRQEATAEVVRAAENNGMSFGRFQEILNHTRMDEGLAERVRQHMREAAR